MLSVGVLYGAYHNSRLSKKAIKEREIEAKKKEIRDVQLAIEKKRLVEGKIFIIYWCYIHFKQFSAPSVNTTWNCSLLLNVNIPSYSWKLFILKNT